MNAVAMAFMVAGGFFLVVSTVGLLRLPDFFTRSHAVGKSETLGALLLMTGFALHLGLELQSVKLFLIIGLIAVTNPTGIHTLSRAALRAGLPIWTRDKGLPDGPHPLPRRGRHWDQPDPGAPEPSPTPDDPPRGSDA